MCELKMKLIFCVTLSLVLSNCNVVRSAVDVAERLEKAS